MNTGPSGFGSLAFNDVSNSPSLDLYQPIMRENSLVDGQLISIHPISMTSSDGPFEFTMPEISGSYIHMPSLRMFIEGSVVKDDGTKLTADDKVSIVDNFATSLFESMHVDFNGVKVNALSTENFHYKNYIELALSYSRYASLTNLKTGLKIHDKPGKYEDFTAGNPVEERSKWISLSKTFQAYTFVAADFMSMDRLIPSTHKLSLKFFRSKDSFSLIQPTADNNTYKIKINKFKLYARYLQVNEQIVHKHLKLHENTSQRFPLVKSELKAFQVAQGASVQNLHNIYTGSLPKTVLMLMVKTSNYTGNAKASSFKFEHFDLNYASLSINGRKVPNDAYTPDMTNDLFQREYRSLFDDLSISHENTGNIFFDFYFRADLLRKSIFFL